MAEDAISIGTALTSENECLSKLVESLKMAEGYARAIAYLRRDDPSPSVKGWLAIAEGFNAMKEKVLLMGIRKVMGN